MLKDVLSDNRLLASKAIEKAIEADIRSPLKAKALEGLKYYKGDHDILQYKLIYIDSEGRVREEKHRSNIKIEHRFHTELVDQKVQYLLSNPVQIETEDEKLKAALAPYLGEEFQELLQDLLEGASNKGQEYVYTYKDETGKMSFQVADSLGVIQIYDDQDRSKLIGILRYYEVYVKDKKGEDVKVIKAEVWTDKDTTYYAQEPGKSTYKFEDDLIPNPKPHIVLEDDKAIYDGGGLGYIPFFKLMNNKEGSTDLEPIKSLVDDYDLMACSLSNNLQDFQEAIYVVKGYNGTDFDSLIQNVKSRKVIGLDEAGGLDVKTVDIPTEARKVKLELDKEAIYKFGMGFDSAQVGDGNITNIVLKARYSLLDLKCNKTERKLRSLIRKLLKVIIDDINAAAGTAYDYSTPEIKITREMMVNEDNLVSNAKTEADTASVKIANVLLAPISDESKLQLICEILGLDFEEEKAKLEAEGPYQVDKALADRIQGGGVIAE